MGGGGGGVVGIVVGFLYIIENINKNLLYLYLKIVMMVIKNIFCVFV